MAINIYKNLNILDIITILFNKLVACHFFDWMSDRAFLKLAYVIRMRKILNLKNPKSFNEKLNWLKLYDRKPLYTTLVDKLAVKEYVANKIGAEYIIPTISIWNDFDEIDLDKLPESFVLKWNHDSSSVYLCKDKMLFDWNAARVKLKERKSFNMFSFAREWPYKSVVPKIFAEKFMEDNTLKELRDYKIFCFNGRVEFFKIDINRFTNHRANYYDKELNLLPFHEKYIPCDQNQVISIPSSIYEMFKLAEILAQDIPFIRIDFYDVNNCIYFGEMTFFPAAANGILDPEEWDLIIGNLLKLPA